MRISPDMFDHGGEVDITSQFPSPRIRPSARLSIRRKYDEYEAYAHWYDSKKDEVLYTSTNLSDVVRFTNKYVSWEDVVIDDN